MKSGPDADHLSSWNFMSFNLKLQFKQNGFKVLVPEGGSSASNPAAWSGFGLTTPDRS